MPDDPAAPKASLGVEREARVDLELPVRFFFLGEEREGVLVNVSMGGAFIRLERPPAAQTVLALSITVPVGDPIYFHATVVRVGEALDGRLQPISGCAVQFLNLSPEAEGRLSYLLKQLSWKP
ncbi:MAG: PilZ domain-containing protein [Deltaproteobacteria bacterium]